MCLLVLSSTGGLKQLPMDWGLKALLCLKPPNKWYDVNNLSTYLIHFLHNMFEPWSINLLPISSGSGGNIKRSAKSIRQIGSAVPCIDNSGGYGLLGFIHEVSNITPEIFIIPRTWNYTIYWPIMLGIRLYLQNPLFVTCRQPV